MIILGVNQKIEDEIIEIAKDNDIRKVIIFGSRVRGDFKRTSDIDIAVIGGNTAEFSAEIEEKVSTLLKFDIVNLSGTVQAELKKSIEKEGKVLYEKV